MLNNSAVGPVTLDAQTQNSWFCGGLDSKLYISTGREYRAVYLCGIVLDEWADLDLIEPPWTTPPPLKMPFSESRAAADSGRALPFRCGPVWKWPGAAEAELDLSADPERMKILSMTQFD